MPVAILAIAVVGAATEEANCVAVDSKFTAVEFAASDPLKLMPVVKIDVVVVIAATGAVKTIPVESAVVTVDTAVALELNAADTLLSIAMVTEDIALIVKPSVMPVDSEVVDVDTSETLAPSWIIVASVEVVVATAPTFAIIKIEVASVGGGVAATHNATACNTILVDNVAMVTLVTTVGVEASNAADDVKVEVEDNTQMLALVRLMPVVSPAVIVEIAPIEAAALMVVNKVAIDVAITVVALANAAAVFVPAHLIAIVTVKD